MASQLLIATPPKAVTDAVAIKERRLALKVDMKTDLSWDQTCLHKHRSKHKFNLRTVMIRQFYTRRNQQLDRSLLSENPAILKTQHEFKLENPIHQTSRVRFRAKKRA